MFCGTSGGPCFGMYPEQISLRAGEPWASPPGQTDTRLRPPLPLGLDGSLCCVAAHKNHLLPIGDQGAVHWPGGSDEEWSRWVWDAEGETAERGHDRGRTSVPMSFTEENTRQGRDGPRQRDGQTDRNSQGKGRLQRQGKGTERNEGEAEGEDETGKRWGEKKDGERQTARDKREQGGRSTSWETEEGRRWARSKTRNRKIPREIL